MKRLSRIVACALGLLAGISAAIAQATSAATSDPAITALSVMGVVADLRPDTHQVIVKTAAGNQVTVTLSDRTDFMRIPPGEKTKEIHQDYSGRLCFRRQRFRPRQDV